MEGPQASQPGSLRVPHLVGLRVPRRSIHEHTWEVYARIANALV